MKSISVVIPSWNGKELLGEFLPSLMKEYQAYSGEKELIVVDDGSTDGTSDHLSGNFPQVRVIRLRENKGFSFACNAGFKESKYEIVVLLNNDVLVGENFIERLVKDFVEKDIFAVSAGIMISGKGEMDLSDFSLGLALVRGMIEIPMLRLKEKPSPFIISCAGGTAAAYDREKLLALGGFDEIYAPFYWEDVDLAYRALKRGWKILFEPDAKCYHRTHSTIERSFSRLHRELISERNRCILFWKNISAPAIWLNHIFWIQFRFMAFIFTLQWHRVFSFFLALAKVKDISARRKIEAHNQIVGDRDIFEQFAKIQKNAQPFFCF